MQFRSILPTATFALVALVMAVPAQAEPPLPNGSSGRVHYDHYRDRGDRDGHWRHHRDRDRHHGRHSGRWRRDRDDDRSGDRSGGTYTGDVSGSREGGNGNYFYVDRDEAYGASRGPVRHNRAGPKIIQPGTNSACSNESGVCVIRPGS